MDQFHIFLCDLGQILLIFFQSFLRITSEEHRIGKPCHIPCPVIDRVIKSEINFLCRFDILFAVGRRISHATGRRIADLDLLLRVFPQVDHCLPVCAQCVMRDLECLFDLHLFARRMNPGQVSKPYKTLRLIQREEIFTQIREILRNDFRIFPEPADHVLV